MAGYKPLKIAGFTTGLVQEREEFLLPDDAYPTLENAYVWRERIKRKQGYELLGRLRRVFTGATIGNSGASPWTFNIFTTVIPPITPAEPNAEIEPGSVVITIGANVLIDQGDGTLATNPVSGVTGVINYSTSVVTITGAGAGIASTINFNYYPGLPVMGLRSRELNNINNEQLVAFDTKYAYIFGATGWQEFIPGTTWTGRDFDFFWSTNYWVNAANEKLFWVTNNYVTSVAGDPIRYTNGIAWNSFAPQITAAGGSFLQQCLAILPFRGRLVVFNTWEGANLATSINFPQRIRWAAIGNPIPNGAYQPWIDDIRGQGGFLDIPTSESIVAVGFVRDNLVIYCERSTWQLRYTGRSIAPFQIEKVNSELGAESTFSAVQFDTSLVGIGDKGVVECDSFKSERIDIKIPDLVFYFNNDAEGPSRVHGIRDFQKRLAYWTYPYKPDQEPTDVYPNRRLVYNYENDSWAIFTDSLTTLGTYQAQSGRRWIDYTKPTDTWARQNVPWIFQQSLFPSIVGGNQQGFVEYLDLSTTNDVSLTITNLVGFGVADTDPPSVVTSPNHNLETGQIIQMWNMPPFFSFFEGAIFYVDRIDINSFRILRYNTVNGQFDLPGVAPVGAYIGGGQMAIRDNFSITSKKFNFIDDGQNVQLGYIDVLFDTTSEGGVSLNVYADYDDSQPTNILPLNYNPETGLPDNFFNSVVPTTTPNEFQSKVWQRVFCATRAAFITIEWTLSNAQMVGTEQESNVQIDAQILWMRAAGRQLPTGF